MPTRRRWTCSGRSRPAAAAARTGGKFTITAGGELAFVTAKDFEDPDDADTDGSYRVTVQVSDGRRRDREALTVTLSNRNEAPTAEAGADRQEIEQGATVTLAGSGSDPDADDRLTYAWTQTGGTEVTLSDASAPAPSFTAPAGPTEEATLTFSLKVTDEAGLYHEDAVSVRVKARPPPVATIAAAAGAVTEGAAATFTVSPGCKRRAEVLTSIGERERRAGAALSGSSPPDSVALREAARVEQDEVGRAHRRGPAWWKRTARSRQRWRREPATS